MSFLHGLSRYLYLDALLRNINKLQESVWRMEFSALTYSPEMSPSFYLLQMSSVIPLVGKVGCLKKAYSI